MALFVRISLLLVAPQLIIGDTGACQPIDKSQELGWHIVSPAIGAQWPLNEIVPIAFLACTSDRFDSTPEQDPDLVGVTGVRRVQGLKSMRAHFCSPLRRPSVASGSRSSS
jgi:hypothetical protein